MRTCRPKAVTFELLEDEEMEVEELEAEVALPSFVVFFKGSSGLDSLEKFLFLLDEMKRKEKMKCDEHLFP